MSNWPLLSVLIWLPILGGALVLALGNARAGAARWLGFAVAVLTFAPPEGEGRRPATLGPQSIDAVTGATVRAMPSSVASSTPKRAMSSCGR